MLNNAAARKVMSGVIEPPARLLLRMHVSPDAVTIAGTVAAVATALICLPQGWFVAAVLILLVIAMSDLLDGTMARLAGTSGPWGNFLDATMDRLADGAKAEAGNGFAAGEHQNAGVNGLRPARVDGRR